MSSHSTCHMDEYCEKQEFKYKCANCKGQFQSENLLNEHREQVSQRNKILLECNYCFKAFYRLDRFLTHRTQCKQKKFICPCCSKVFKSDFEKYYHCKTCQPIDEAFEVYCKTYGMARRWVCRKCHEIFTTECTLNEHTASKHGKGVGSYYCGVCHQHFQRYGKLKEHYNTGGHYRWKCTT